MFFAFSRVVFLLLLLSAGVLFAFVNNDDAFVRQLVERLQAYSEQRPIEKVYLHTDRDIYLTGETIWIKGYLFNGNSHVADTVSRVLYVELVDPAARKIRQRLQLRVTDSYAPGQLSLPDSISAGTYQLRAYTSYMRNEPDDYFYTKTLTILQPDASASTGSPQQKPLPRQLDVQFLPEGGQLVAGLDGRVAFKAIGSGGRSVPVSGFVLNAKKDTITGFFSLHAGMGYFAIKPEAGQTYTAFVQHANGSLDAYPIPVVKPQGIVMQVDNLTSKEYIRVYLRHNKVVETESSATAMTLVAQTRGILVHAVTVPFGKTASVVQLPKAEFPEGIAQLTLFDEANKPVGERLVFVNRNEQLTVGITSDKTTYKNREKVELTVTTTDAAGKPVAANLSLAAVDARLSPEADSNSATITSHLLLSSDLMGTIEQPGYYFDSRQANRTQHLDLLMMTQGWRRFAWADVLAGTIPARKYPLEQGLSLTGRVVRPNGKDIGGKVKLTFILARRDSLGKEGQRDFLVGESDELGNYAAYDLDFSDTTTVLIQGTKGKANRDLVITLDQLLNPAITVTRVPYNPFEFRRDELAEFVKRTSEYLEIERQIRRNGEVLLQSVTVKAKRVQERDSRTIYGTPDASVKFDQNNAAGRLTILDVIQGRIAGVQITGSGFSARVQIRGAANFSGPVEPLFLLDGMPVDLQTVLSISVQDVEKVDVLKGASAAIYGSRGSGGVISVLTKRGSPEYDLSKDAAPGTLVAKLPGYAAVRQFYAPRYAVKNEQSDRRPDYRTTLFWEPLVQTGADGKATVSFYTSDSKTNLRIRAEGATASGRPGVGTGTVRVE
ncbi:TonB-dependent receptor plug domain-containing protein [Spirosoma utsteinense]|uniref:TonB-dependent receptor plug domain-containing protein n=1 Tax=Spirosoma utsteinense TaxID=2585773 RepID=UPI0016497022|nr:TonB-dependent receptor plug domain-containing protein [Spirosoma utsteinense]MBC3786070.1 TonB-dependent SusC/RagA subfamily outer membrane receptor [Spirosoma utsteinense]